MERSVVDEILSYIEENLGEDLSLEYLAKEFNYSKFYLSRAFAENVGCTYISTFKAGG